MRLRASFCHSPGITRPAPEPSPHQTRYTRAIDRSPIAFEAFEQPTTVGSEALEYPSPQQRTEKHVTVERSYEGPAQGATIGERPDEGIRKCRMKAIVVTDEAAGTAGMTLVERPEPE